MAQPLEVEVKICSAKDLKNVNWRYGDLCAYAVAWLDPVAKFSTRADDQNGTCPLWGDVLTIPLPPGRRPEDCTLFIDIVHAGARDDTKPLIGSARIPLSEALDDAGGIGRRCFRSLKLKRPSGRPQGKLEVEIEVRPPHYHAPPPPAATYPYPYQAPPYAAQTPSGYPYKPSPYEQYAAPTAPYGQMPPVNYGQRAAYGEVPVAVAEEKKKSKFGMGTGLAVGAAAGLLGGLAISEGVDALEDKIADDVTERVENDLAEEGDYYDGDDF